MFSLLLLLHSVLSRAKTHSAGFSLLSEATCKSQEIVQTDSRDNGGCKDDGVGPVPRVPVDVTNDGHALPRSLRHCLGRREPVKEPSWGFL